jgi:hypothetical protein
MPTLRYSSVREIAVALVSRLSSGTGIPVERISFVAEEPEYVPHMQGENEIVIRLGDESAGESIEGGGRYVNIRTRTFFIHMRSRMWLDEANSDFIQLTSATDGHIKLEDSVVDTLEKFLLTESMDGIALPLQIGTVTMPRRDNKDPGWISSRIELSFQYLRSLSLPEYVVPT